MRACSDCGKRVPWRVKIAGKVRSLTARRRCLECSPFGSRRRSGKSKTGTLVRCECCDRDFIYNRSKGNAGRICGSCRTNNKRFAVKARAIEYLGGRCKLCGYSQCPAALSFHHRRSGTKDFNISANHSRKWSDIQRELNKCDLLCVRCHAEVHAGLHPKLLKVKKRALLL